MTDETPIFRHLHGVYCQLANAQLVLTMERIYWWSHFKARGFTEADLRLVLRYLWHEIKAERRRYGALKFSNLIQDVDRFEEDLFLARAWDRNYRPVPTSKQQTVAAWHPAMTEPVTPTARPISELIAALRKAAE